MQMSKFGGVAAGAPKARESQTESGSEVRPHLSDIRGVDGLSLQLYFQEKIDPQPCAGPAGRQAWLPWPVGGTPSWGAKGNFAESPQKLAHVGPKSCPFLWLLCHIARKGGPKSCPNSHQGLTHFGAGVPKTTHFDHFFLQKMQLLLVAPSPNYTVLLKTLRPSFVCSSSL